MSDKRTVSLVGAGKLGSLIIERLLALGAIVRVLARDPKKVAARHHQNVEVVQFDVVTATEEETTSALKGSYSVISSLQGGKEVIVDAQIRLVNAAHKVGARRFFPSDFSANIFRSKKGENFNTDLRLAFAEYADKLHKAGSFEIVHVLMGVFTDAAVWNFVGLLRGQDEISYYGESDSVIETTTWEDTASFTAAAAVDHREMPNRLNVRGDSFSPKSLADEYAKAGRKVHVKCLGSIDDLRALIDKTFKADPSAFMQYLPLMYHLFIVSGQGLLEQPLHNALFPQIKPESLQSAIKRNAV